MATLPKLPTKPTAGIRNYSYPGDLIADGRLFYTQIQLIKYNPDIGTSSGARTPQGGIILPIPKKINESQTLNWEAVSATSTLIGAVTSTFGQQTGYKVAAQAQMVAAAATMVGAETGIAMNPFLWMLFRSPNFKEHTFSWTFTPSNAQETETIRSIIRELKFNSLPKLDPTKLLYRYPMIALIKFMPNDFFTFKLKPCAIAAVQVDYSGGGVPSFFKDGAPTVINLTLSLKEIEIWTQDNYDYT